jgi:hypothetical protein
MTCKWERERSNRIGRFDAHDKRAGSEKRPLVAMRHAQHIDKGFRELASTSPSVQLQRKQEHVLVALIKCNAENRAAGAVPEPERESIVPILSCYNEAFVLAGTPCIAFGAPFFDPHSCIPARRHRWTSASSRLSTRCMPNLHAYSASDLLI